MVFALLSVMGGGRTVALAKRPRRVERVACDDYADELSMSSSGRSSSGRSSNGGSKKSSFKKNGIKEKSHKSRSGGSRA
eukprot:6198075-Pleurochrysis_carterae.AAC.1